MAFMEKVRSPRLTFAETLVSLLLGAAALMSSHWCEGQQKVPKPLCTAQKLTKCIPVPGISNSVAIQFSWETGDDSFVFPTFHSGLWISCEENIYTEAREEKCRGFHTLTPGSERGMLWLSLSMELMYIGLLSISCVLLSLQLCLDAFFPSAQSWGQLLNAFSAIFTVLGGLLGMVAHMMFMSVFQTTASMGPEDFKPHSYGYSWGFYVAWVAFTTCMASGVSTLNNYTKKVLMVNLTRTLLLKYKFTDIDAYPRPAPYPPVPYSHPKRPSIAALSPQPPQLSPLSPYYDPPSPPSPRSPRLTHSLSPNLHHSQSFPLPPPDPESMSPYHHRHSLPSPSTSLPLSVHSFTPQYYSEEEYSPL